MSDRSPELETVLDAIVEKRLAALHTCMPARVVSFDADSNSIEAQPLLQVSLIDDDGADQIETLPQIGDVPVVYPRGGGGDFELVFPLEEGDIVTLVFAERSLDRWLSGGGEEVNPADLRKHQLSDPYAIPGGYPLDSGATIEPDRVILRYGATGVHIADDKIELGGKDATDEVPLDSKVQIELDKIKTQIDSLGQDMLLTATHTHLDSLGAPTGPPVVPGPAGGQSYSKGDTASALVTIKE